RHLAACFHGGPRWPARARSASPMRELPAAGNLHDQVQRAYAGQDRPLLEREVGSLIVARCRDEAQFRTTQTPREHLQRGRSRPARVLRLPRSAEFSFRAAGHLSTVCGRSGRRRAPYVKGDRVNHPYALLLMLAAVALVLFIPVVISDLSEWRKRKR